MGEEALEGLQGVELIGSDFHSNTETNIVWYDPALTSVDRLVKALKDAGTYLGTAK